MLFNAPLFFEFMKKYLWENPLTCFLKQRSVRNIVTCIGVCKRASHTDSHYRPNVIPRECLMVRLQNLPFAAIKTF